MQTKVCPQCGRERPLAEFGRRGRNDERPQSYCRSCRSVAQSDSRYLRAQEMAAKEQLRYLRRVGRMPEDLAGRAWYYLEREQVGRRWAAVFRVGSEIVKVRRGNVVSRKPVSR